MTGTQRFRQYLQIIPQHERESWLFATLGNMDDEIASLRAKLFDVVLSAATELRKEAA
jgi:hypothetical protein